MSTTVSALSPRALLIGIIFAGITCVVVCYAELVVAQIQIGFLQLPPVVVALLLTIIGLHVLARRLDPRLRLAAHELFTIHVMMLLAAMVSSRGLLDKLIALLVTPNYFTNWGLRRSLFYQFIPRWAVPWDPSGKEQQPVTARFFESLRPGERVPWALWVGPLAAWSIFVVLMFCAYLCLAAILRRQWVDNEKLTFPLVQVPLEIIRGATDTDQRSFLRNPMTWLGFALPAIVFSFNGLHQCYPSIPEIPVQMYFFDEATRPAWSANLYWAMYASFAAVGLFYLLPTDLLFSLWFFYCLLQLVDVLLALHGYIPDPMPLYGCPAFAGYQVMGAYFIIAGNVAWSARPHLASVWRAVRSGPCAEDAGEMMPYRAAVIGFAGCVLLSAAWLGALGMTYWYALFQLTILFLVIAIVMARSTAECGMLMTETSFRPLDVYRLFGDARNLGGANLTAGSFLDALWMRDQRGLVLTGFLDAMKLGDGVRVRRRSIVGVIVLAIVVAVLVGGYLHMVLPYRIGGLNMYYYVYQGNARRTFVDTRTIMGRATPFPQPLAQLHFAIGVLFTLLLVMARARLAWFPLHPMGFALCTTWTMTVFWFACLVAWLCKVLILRYGGMRLFTRARPFFLGMVLGEFTMALLWTIPSIFWRTPTPFFPWP